MISIITALLLVAVFYAIRAGRGCLKRYRIYRASARDIEQLKISILDYNADLKSILNEFKRIAAGHYGKDIPAAPRNLKANAITSTQVQLSWDASAGGGEVEGYRVYRDGVQVANSSGTNYIDSGLGPAKTYTYTVEGVHKGGSISTQSTSVSVTTTLSAVKVFSGLSESFNENPLNPKRWRSYAQPNSAYANPNTAVTAKNHRLEIMTTQGITEGGCAGISTVSLYDATDSEVFVKLDDPGEQGKLGLEVYFDLYVDDNAVRPVLAGNILSAGKQNAVRLVLTGNILSARKQLDGHWSDLARIRYDPSKMNWWRFQEKAGTLYCQYSDNAQDWKELYKAPDPFPLAMVRVRLGARTLQPEAGGAGIPAFDSLNILPVSASLSGVST